MEFCGPILYKACSKCNENKPLENFCKSAKGKFQKTSVCKTCEKQIRQAQYPIKKEILAQRNKEWQTKNKEKVNAKTQRFYENNKEYHAHRNKEYRKNNVEKIKEGKRRNYKNNYTGNNPLYKLKFLLRGRLNKALKNNYKTGSAVRDLGCSIEFLKQYLESKFQPGMTWDNIHIDHIRPLASFDLTDPEQLKQACHYTNLQPLWPIDNLKKGAKHDYSVRA